MWIQVRTMDGKESVQIDKLSKLTTIEDLKLKIETHFDVSPKRQRLFFGGKQVGLNILSFSELLFVALISGKSLCQRCLSCGCLLFWLVNDVNKNIYFILSWRTIIRCLITMLD